MNGSNIFKWTMWASKKRIIREYSKAYYQDYYSMSKACLEEILPDVPDIGNSLFRFNYLFGVCYIAWYKAAKSLGADEVAAIQEIWALTEDFLHLIPRPIMKLAAKPYLGNWRSKAPAFEEQGNNNLLHPFDYKIRFIPVDDNTFELHFCECGMKKLYEQFDVIGLMPGVCRVDYLMFNYMGIGFERTKTLGDGDDCCNCRYSLRGRCEWAPDKGFTDRK